jgi:uncharacterized protein (TIGR00251 family)
MTDKTVPEGQFTETIPLIVTAGSGNSSIAGMHNGRLKVRITSPPHRGRANRALIEFISKKTKIPKKDIEIISGLKSPMKEVVIRKKTGESILNILINSIE